MSERAIGAPLGRSADAGKGDRIGILPIGFGPLQEVTDDIRLARFQIGNGNRIEADIYRHDEPLAAEIVSGRLLLDCRSDGT